MQHNNIFVKDYCLARFDDISISTLKKYLQDNYLDERDLVAFIKDVIRNELKIEPVSDEMVIAQKYLADMPELSQRIFDAHSKKREG